MKPISWRLPRATALPSTTGVGGAATLLATKAVRPNSASPAPASSDGLEAQWITRARAGDEAAQFWLCEQYRLSIVRLATHILRRPDDAEDVAQEVMVRMLQRLHTYRGDAPFAHWLYRITVRMCLENTRRNTRRREVPLFDSQYDNQASTSPSSTDSDNRLLIAKLLDELSPRTRAALILHEVEQLSYEEIASVVGVPVGTIRSRINAARTRFRALYLAAQKDTENA